VKIFVAHDGGTGCCYYRMELPIRQLEKHGHEVTWRSVNDDVGATITGSDMAGHDLIIGQRLNVHRGMEAWRRARGPFSRLVYDTDDDCFSVNPESWAAYQLYSKPEVRDAVEHMAGISDLVTVTTEHLAGVMREHTGAGNITVLPNYIPEFVLDTVPPSQSGHKRPAIGYQGGASHGTDIGVMAAPVRRFLKRFPGWDLRLGGTDFRPTFRAGDQGKFSPWVPIYDNPAGYYSTLDWDIGLAPLAMRTFDYSKSNLKVLEYAARGIPSVATDCVLYQSFIRHGENGFLVKEDHEWLKYLSILASDDALRLKMGEQARQDARSWTIEENYVKWETAYQSLFPVRV
jgi:glycosyltransferase involved in cell wall biosynthesis